MLALAGGWNLPAYVELPTGCWKLPEVSTTLPKVCKAKTPFQIVGLKGCFFICGDLLALAGGAERISALSFAHIRAVGFNILSAVIIIRYSQNYAMFCISSVFNFGN